MKELIVNKEDKPVYTIYLEHDFNQLVSLVSKLELANKKICVVTETRVASFYVDHIVDILKKECNTVVSFVFPEGEKNKKLSTVSDIYRFLIEHKFDRDDCLFALGGGVVGDITGYAAATYLRGIRFVQCPTSLLAMVDSSIGGKTGVDYEGYKNMVGAFYQPSAVYISLSALSTLNERQFYSGFGEIIKHSLIDDIDYFHLLNRVNADNIATDIDTMEQIIYRSLQIKKEVVEEDPYEKGRRIFLNYGHTLGHAIEKQMDFSLLHGECVALGIMAVSFISLKRNMITQDEYNQTKQLLLQYHLPIQCQDFDIEACITSTMNDKKVHQGKVTYILPQHIGHVCSCNEIVVEEIKDALQSLK